VQPAQLYETTIHNRDTGDAFSFAVVPRRSLAEYVDPNSWQSVVDVLGLEAPRAPEPVELWSLPFLVDSLMGRRVDYPWILEPGGSRRGQTPTPFAQYLTYAAEIPFEQSPLEGKSLAQILAGTSGVGSIVVGFAAGNPLMLVIVPAAIILCYGATGLGQGLQIILRTYALRLAGMEDQAPAEEPNDEG
jgi:hypothetical protein